MELVPPTEAAAASNDICKECGRSKSDSQLLQMQNFCAVCQRHAPVCLCELCCCCANDACRDCCREVSVVLFQRPKSDYALVLCVFMILLGWMLLLMGAKESMYTSVHFRWYHWMPMLLQNCALLFFLGYQSTNDTDSSFFSDSRDQEMERCTRTFRIVCILLLGVGGFLLACMFAMWDYFDPFVAASSPTTATTAAQSSDMPGWYLVASSLCVLLGIALRYMNIAMYIRENSSY